MGNITHENAEVMPSAGDPANVPFAHSGYATRTSHSTVYNISSRTIGSIFTGRMIPIPAKVANAVQTHHTTALVGSHGPLWVRMCVQVSLPSTKNINI